MTRLSILLMLAVIASALYLVHTRYESRRLYVELENSTSQSHKLEVENERLELEKRAQATPMRVEKLARERLQMRTATPAITQYVTYRDGALTGVSASLGAAAAAAVGAKQGRSP